MDRLSESLLSSRLYCLRTHGVANATIIDVIFIIIFLYILLSPVEKCFDLALRKGKAVGETKPTESGIYFFLFT